MNEALSGYTPITDKTVTRRWLFQVATGIGAPILAACGPSTPDNGTPPIQLAASSSIDQPTLNVTAPMPTATPDNRPYDLSIYKDHFGSQSPFGKFAHYDEQTKELYTLPKPNEAIPVAAFKPLHEATSIVSFQKRPELGPAGQPEQVDLAKTPIDTTGLYVVRVIGVATSSDSKNIRSTYVNYNGKRTIAGAWYLVGRIHFETGEFYPVHYRTQEKSEGWVIQRDNFTEGDKRVSLKSAPTTTK